MKQPRRFADEPRTGIVAMQWANWAHALAGRHTQTAARHQRMTLTLARKQLVFQSARWEKHTWMLAPQIRLAIAALLPSGILGRVNEREARRGHDLPRTMRSASATRPAAVEEQRLRPEREQTRENPFVLRTTPFAAQPAQNPPLERIMARMQQVESKTRPEQLMLELTTQILQRVTQTHGRVEERNPRVPLVLQNPSAASGERAAQGGQEINSFERITPRGRSGNVPWDAPGALPINLDQLTDQVARRIDNRITAYRERRGKGA